MQYVVVKTYIEAYQLLIITNYSTYYEYLYTPCGGNIYVITLQHG